MARLLFTSRHFGSLDNPQASYSAKQLSKLIGNPIYFMKQTHGNKVTMVDSQSSPTLMQPKVLVLLKTKSQAKTFSYTQADYKMTSVKTIMLPLTRKMVKKA